MKYLAEYTVQKSEPKRLQNYLNKFKEELTTMKANLAEMEVIINKRSHDFV